MGAIDIFGLSKVFRGRRLAVVEALTGLSLSIDSGEIFGFLGPNGAGKSTTIKLLLGLIRPTAGRADILGIDARTARSRNSVGYLPENPAFYDYLNAAEYLDIVGRCFGMKGTALQARIEEVLRQLDLWEARKRPIRSYSKGMVQRVGLAQTLIHDPEVYILDEPMSGLDPLGRALVKEIMINLKQRGKSIFFSTHITSDVESVCDRVGIILSGELKTVERVSSVMSEGITGYMIQTRDAANGSTTETYVPKEKLSLFLADIQNSAKEVMLIEPRRKSLEDFFLDVVKTKPY